MERRSVRRLLETGHLQVGQELVYKNSSSEKTMKVSIDTNGFLVDKMGNVYKTPTAAAKSINNNKSINGWKAWRDAVSHSTLNEIWIEATFV